MMLLDNNYKDEYERLFKEILQKKGSGYFDEAALPSYTHSNKLMSFLFWRRLEMALGMAKNIRDYSVLDFGCGGAVTFKYFQENDCTITGCENQFLELTKQVSNHFNIKSTLLKDIFETNGEYDKIFALDVLEHVDELGKYLSKLKSLLKDDGQMIVSGPTENFLYKMGRMLAGFSGHYHVRNIYQIEKALEEVGLRRVRLRSLYPMLPFFRISLWAKSRLQD